jgi:hypothetical protein
VGGLAVAGNPAMAGGPGLKAGLGVPVAARTAPALVSIMTAADAERATAATRTFRTKIPPYRTKSWSKQY